MHIKESVIQAIGKVVWGPEAAFCLPNFQKTFEKHFHFHENQRYIFKAFWGVCEGDFWSLEKNGERKNLVSLWSWWMRNRAQQQTQNTPINIWSLNTWEKEKKLLRGHFLQTGSAVGHCSCLCRSSEKRHIVHISASSYSQLSHPRTPFPWICLNGVTTLQLTLHHLLPVLSYLWQSLFIHGHSEDTCGHFGTIFPICSGHMSLQHSFWSYQWPFLKVHGHWEAVHGILKHLWPYCLFYSDTLF